MKTFSIREAFDKGWHIWKSNWKLLVSTTALFVFFHILSPDGGTRDEMSLERGMLSLVLGIVEAVLYIGWVKMLLKLYDREATGFHELFNHIKLFWKLLVAGILWGLLVISGLILFVVPGIYFYLKYQFVGVTIIDHPSTSIRGAFRKSAKLSDKVKWKLLGFNLVYLLVLVAGALTYVGELLTLPLAMLASIYIYRHLSAHQEG